MCERAERGRGTHLPPMTFESPLNTFVRLLTTTSAYGRTSTLTKFPIESSTTMRKSCVSASARRRGRSAARRSGFEGNSVKSARIGGVEGSVCPERMPSSASMSASSPEGRKWHPGPHFCRILSVSVYGKLPPCQR